MRTGSFYVILAIAGLALGGCSSMDKLGSGVAASTSSGSSGSGTGTGTGTGTGSSTGTSTGQTNPTGATSFVFNDGGNNTNGNALTEITTANDGAGINQETATVSVNTGSDTMTWSDTTEMKLFKTSITGVATDNLGNSANFQGYKEYRTITADTDAELQLWTYTNSQIGQYTVFNDPSAANNNNVSLFFQGTETPTANLPAGTATYNGKFGGTAVVDNFLSPERTLDDPFDTDAVAGSTYDPNGTWRIVGDVQITADFGAGTVNGSISNTTWRQFTGSPTSPDGYITITPAETAKPFHDYTITGTITDSKFSGNVEGPAGSVVTGDNALQGGFFGPNAEEVAGIVRSRTTSAGPRDGRSPNEENRRGNIDLRGVFQGSR